MASREWTEHHLTPGGWVKGSGKTDFNSFDRPIPEDRVLTEVYEEYMSSSYGGIDKTVGRVWSCGDAKKIVELVAKYGSCPEHL